MLGAESDMDALVDGEARDLAQVMVAVRADGADAVGRKGDGFGVALVDLKEFFFAEHV